MNPYLPKLSTKIRLIGLHGKAGSGKDTVASYLTENYTDTYSESFAGPLKEGLQHIFGIYGNQFQDRKLKETIIPLWRRSPRELAQYYGTEIFRSHEGHDFWIRRLYARLDNLYIPKGEDLYEDGDIVVITDVRFQNEYDFIIQNNGFIIHLTRPGADGNIGIPGHSSESPIDLHNKERTFQCSNDDTFQQLYTKVDSILTCILFTS